MDRSSLMSVAVAASVATILSVGATPTQAAGGASQPTDQFTLQVSPTQNLSNAFLVYRDTTSGSPDQILPIPGTFDANSTDTITIAGNGSPFVTKDFMMLGIYNSPGITISGLFASLNTTAAQAQIAKGAAFEQTFPNTFTESQLEDALLTNNTITIAGFFDSAVAPGNNTIGGIIPLTINGLAGLVDYSSAANGGSLSISQSAVPEPASGSLLGLIAMKVLTCRRRMRTNSPSPRSIPHRPPV